MSRVRLHPANVCNSCLVLDVAPCPILDLLYRRGLEGMETCEMREVVFKVVEKEKFKYGYGIKNRDKRRTKDVEDL